MYGINARVSNLKLSLNSTNFRNKISIQYFPVDKVANTRNWGIKVVTDDRFDLLIKITLYFMLIQ